jgi:hypothetical protein
MVSYSAYPISVAVRFLLQVFVQTQTLYTLTWQV